MIDPKNLKLRCEFCGKPTTKKYAWCESCGKNFTPIAKSSISDQMANKNDLSGTEVLVTIASILPILWFFSKNGWGFWIYLLAAIICIIIFFSIDKINKKIAERFAFYFIVFIVSGVLSFPYRWVFDGASTKDIAGKYHVFYEFVQNGEDMSTSYHLKLDEEGGAIWVGTLNGSRLWRTEMKAKIKGEILILKREGAEKGLRFEIMDNGSLKRLEEKSGGGHHILSRH